MYIYREAIEVGEPSILDSGNIQEKGIVFP